MQKLRSRVAVVAAGAAGAFLVGWLALSWERSRLPGTYDAMAYAIPDYGGGRSGHAHGGGTPVTALAGPRSGRPDVRLTLTARRAEVRLASGTTVDAWTFDGRVPGRELRARAGDLVEVTLVNADVADGVSLHWHGLDVPNAEDGVSGVTQDAVPPGGRHTYRFRALQTGTYWYHSHQVSADAVARGLYGPIVVLPREPLPHDLDLTVMSHRLGGADVFGTSDVVERRVTAPGTRVRLRLVNTDDSPRRFTLAGTRFRVLSIDGADVVEPTPIAGRELEVAAGGRYDIGFAMPEAPVTLRARAFDAAVAFSRDGRGVAREPERAPTFDPAAYGRRTAPPRERFDRSFELVIGKELAFRDGRPGYHWSVNGKVYPELPMPVVRPGDVVRMVLENDTREDHPMHLHGHHVRVLSRDGVPVRGAPWIVDTLNVKPGERYVVTFRATNRGVWMLHCHDLEHAAEGLTMHLAYEGVGTPFRIGGEARNRPE